MTGHIEGDAGLAPVIPLFGAQRTRERSTSERAREEVADGPREDTWHATWVGEAPPAPTGLSRRTQQRGAPDGHRDERDDRSRIDVASDRLLKRLRRRGLSVAEARDELRSDDIDDEAAQACIDDFCARGWLDDATLAENLVYSAVTKRREGRRTIAAGLRKRRIPDEIVEQALAAIPDDDAERAREYADHKVRSLRSLPPEVAIRRLAGQLHRRGYPPSLAMDAAREAWSNTEAP